MPFPGVVDALTTRNSPLAAAFAPEPFVSGGEAAGLQELADLDQGSTQDFPIQGYAVTAAWAKKYPNTLKAFTTALSQGQQAADTDRAAVETALQKFLGIQPQPAAFISLPAFPLGMDAVRLQRVVSAMTRFGLLPKTTDFPRSAASSAARARLTDHGAGTAGPGSGAARQDGPAPGVPPAPVSRLPRGDACPGGTPAVTPHRCGRPPASSGRGAVPEVPRFSCVPGVPQQGRPGPGRCSIIPP